ncbi:MAG: hypothetical protein AAGC60_09800 [Acidobacteriota bacterium]
MPIRFPTPWLRRSTPHSSPPTGCRPSIARSLTLSLMLGGLAVAAHAADGTLVHQSTVYQIANLGSDRVDYGELVDFADGARPLTATRSGDTWLTVLNPVITAPQSLVRFDAATGAALDSVFLVPPTGFRPVTTLGTGPNSLLWVLAKDYFANETDLGQLDPVTGTITRIATMPGVLAGFTVADGEVFSLLESTEIGVDAQLARVELATGAVEVLADLPDSSCAAAGDLDFDDGGALHIAIADHTCGIILPSFEVVLHSYRPLSDGSFLRISSSQPSLGGEPAALEVTGGVAVIDVPTLDARGLALLIGLLALGGLLAIRRDLLR